VGCQTADIHCAAIQQHYRWFHLLIRAAVYAARLRSGQRSIDEDQMKIKVWNASMSVEETKDLAYWERNMLALVAADGWYNDDILFDPKVDFCPDDCAALEKAGIVLKTYKPRYHGWRRVLSISSGKITFHVPDDFDVGDLGQIDRNWDGHTTEEKWKYVASLAGVKIECQP
jgi:hypothetical protein